MSQRSNLSVSNLPILSRLVDFLDRERNRLDGFGIAISRSGFLPSLSEQQRYVLAGCILKSNASDLAAGIAHTYSDAAEVYFHAGMEEDSYRVLEQGIKAMKGDEVLALYSQFALYRYPVEEQDQRLEDNTLDELIEEMRFFGKYACEEYGLEGQKVGHRLLERASITPQQLPISLDPREDGIEGWKERTENLAALADTYQSLADDADAIEYLELRDRFEELSFDCMRRALEFCYVAAEKEKKYELPALMSGLEIVEEMERKFENPPLSDQLPSVDQLLQRALTAARETIQKSSSREEAYKSLTLGQGVARKYQRFGDERAMLDAYARLPQDSSPKTSGWKARFAGMLRSAADYLLPTSTDHVL